MKHLSRIEEEGLGILFMEANLQFTMLDLELPIFILERLAILINYHRVLYDAIVSLRDNEHFERCISCHNLFMILSNKGLWTHLNSCYV